MKIKKVIRVKTRMEKVLTFFKNFEEGLDKNTTLGGTFSRKVLKHMNPEARETLDFLYFKKNSKLLTYGYREYLKNKNVFKLDANVINALCSKRTSVREIDKRSLTDLPRVFLLDLSADNTYFFTFRQSKVYPHKFELGLDSCIVMFLKRVGEGDNDFELAEPYDFDLILLNAVYKGPKNSENIILEGKKGTQSLYSTSDTISIAEMFDSDKQFGSENFFKTIEVMYAENIAEICHEHKVSMKDRETYSKRYLSTVARYLSLIREESLPKGEDFHREIQQRLNSIFITMNHEDVIEGEKLRRLLLRNLVISFLKSLGDKKLIEITTKDKVSRFRKKKAKEDTKPRQFTSIRIDLENLNLIQKRKFLEYKEEQSEREINFCSYQVEVDATSAFRWVLRRSLKDGEPVFESKPCPKDSTKTLYKVKRKVRSYVRNKHLPKKPPSDEPKVKLVKSI